jgi:GTP-binding protein HflX
LRGELLSREDLTDLALLQLDLVACLRRCGGKEARRSMRVPHTENREGRTWDFMEPGPVSEMDLDFTEFITELENEFVRERGRFYVTKDRHDRCVIVSVVIPGREKNVDDYTPPR